MTAHLMSQEILVLDRDRTSCKQGDSRYISPHMQHCKLRGMTVGTRIYTGCHAALPITCDSSISGHLDGHVFMWNALTDTTVVDMTYWYAMVVEHQHTQ